MVGMILVSLIVVDGYSRVFGRDMSEFDCC